MSKSVNIMQAMYLLNQPINKFPVSTNNSETAVSLTTHEKLCGIFGETRDLTEEEAEIYDKLLDSEAIETNIRLF